MSAPTRPVDTRPAQKPCAVCDWVPPDGTDVPGVCGRCRGGHTADLADLGALFHTLARSLQPGPQGHTDRPGKVGKRPDPPAPLRMDALNLRGPAGHLAGDPARPPGDGASIAQVVAHEAAHIRVFLGLVWPPRLWLLATPARLTLDLKTCTTHTDRYATTAPATALRATWGAVRAVRDRAHSTAGLGAHRIQLGPCPRVLDDTTVCGRPLWVDPALDTAVRCPACRTHWERSHFLWLRRNALHEAP